MATEQLPTDVSTWTLPDAEKAITLAVEATPGGKAAFDANKKFIEDGDHFQSGQGWVGPNAEGADAAVVTRVMAGVERQFTPVDLIDEVLERGANALLKHQADIQLVPIDGPEPDPATGELDEADQERLDGLKTEGDAILSTVFGWWDRVHFLERCREAVKRSRGFGRGALRLWIPVAHLTETVPEEGLPPSLTLPSGLELDEALERIELSAPKPDACTVYTHPETHSQVAIYVTELDNEKTVELWYLDPDRDEEPDTIVRQIQGDRATELRIAMGGRLPINQMEASVLISEAVRRQQKRLNFYESILVRVGEAAGFPERYISNASPQGIWLTTTPDGPALQTKVENGVTWYLHEVPRTLGASITTELRGFEIPKDPDDLSGAVSGVTTPSVTIKEPTDPDYAIKAAWHARRTILEQCKQAHVLTNSEAAPSGYSREQARADFEDDLDGIKPAAEMLIADTLSAVLAICAAMGAENVLERFRVVVNLHVSSGPISPEERQQNTEKQKAGLLSRETSMARDGVEDVDAEIKRIDSGPFGQLALLAKRAEALRALTDAGAPLSWSAKRVGFTDEEIAELSTTFDDTGDIPELRQNGGPPVREEEEIEEEVAA